MAGSCVQTNGLRKETTLWNHEFCMWRRQIELDKGRNLVCFVQECQKHSEGDASHSWTASSDTNKPFVAITCTSAQYFSLISFFFQQENAQGEFVACDWKLKLPYQNYWKGQTVASVSGVQVHCQLWPCNTKGQRGKVHHILPQTQRLIPGSSLFWDKYLSQWAISPRYLH